MVGLRAYLRQRERLIAGAADAIRHMQKALRQMNLLLDNVVSDITGVTGMAIMRAILAGERDAGRLAALRDRRCRADERVIAGSLEGHYHEEHLFELRQAVRSEEHTSELQSLMRISYAVFCLKTKKQTNKNY